MNTSAHPVAPEEVMAFLDGELSIAEAEAISEHLKRCSECAGLAEQFHGTSAALSRWSVPIAPRMVEDTVEELTGKESSGGKIGKANIFIRASFWSWKQWTVWIGTTTVGLAVLFAAAGSFYVAQKRVSVHSVTVAGRAGAPQSEIEAYGTAGKVDSLVAVQAPMIARTVTLTVVTRDFAASRTLLEAILARRHGYAAQMSVNTPENAQRSLQ